ncbi:hypothetical protein [Halobellus captivus]|uniref:hypothetical protein n=1 Tax=Halobellus captivus TaxID=2592614 RepID=UPI00119F5757|nr:hypothetical protein [Halobellus captivus]
MSGADTSEIEDDYTDGGSVLWGDLATGIAGIGIAVLAYAYASVIGLLRDGVTGFVDGIGSWYASLVGAPFDAGTEQFDRAAQMAADGLSLFGPAAFPVAVLVAIAMVTLVLWGVSRYV